MFKQIEPKVLKDHYKFLTDFILRMMFFVIFNFQFTPGLSV